MQDVEKDKTMVQELLDFKGKLDCLITDAFSNNEKFLTILKVIFHMELIIYLVLYNFFHQAFFGIYNNLLCVCITSVGACLSYQP